MAGEPAKFHTGMHSADGLLKDMEYLTVKLAKSGKEVETAAKKKDAEALKKVTADIRGEQCAKCHDTFRVK